MAARFSGSGQPYDGLARMTVLGEARWTGEVRLIEEHLTDPLRWQKPRRIFVNSMSDLFHERLPFEAIDAVFSVMLLAQRHQFQVLTKRPERMLEYLLSPGRRSEIMEGAAVESFDEISLKGRSGRLPEPAVQDWEDDHAPCGIRIKNVPWPLPNVWLGVSVEDQATADERIPRLLQTPAAIRWISYEPALGPLDLTVGFRIRDGVKQDALYGSEGLRWVVSGGESGPDARPSHPGWFRQVRDDCAAAGVKFFMKQITDRGRKLDFDAWPADLQIREYPLPCVNGPR